MGVNYIEVVVSYDVSEDKRRNKLFKKLKNFVLLPLQKSLFWGRILPAEKVAIRRLFEEILDKKTDSAIILNCQLAKEVSRWGFNLPEQEFFEKKDFYVF